MTVLSSAKARQDLLDILRYLAPRNPAAARRMQSVIRAKVGALAAAPYMGRAGRIAERLGGTRELAITGTPYLAVYRVRPDSVQILTVVHGARDWPGGDN